MVKDQRAIKCGIRAAKSQSHGGRPWARIRPQSAAEAPGSAQGACGEACRMCPDVEKAAAVPCTPGLLYPSVPGPPEEENLLKEAFSYGYPQVGH